MVCLFSSDSQWFKSYGGSNIKIMAQALKMGVPRPNDNFFASLSLSLSLSLCHALSELHVEDKSEVMGPNP